MENYQEIFNPFIKRYNDLYSQIKNAGDDNEKLIRELKWYNLRNEDEFEINLSTITSRLDTKSQEIKLLLKKSDKINTEITLHKAKLKSKINPLYYFSEEQNILKKKIDSLECTIDSIQSSVINKKRDIQRMEEKKNRLLSDFERYNIFDHDKCKTTIDNNHTYVNSLKNEFKRISKQKVRVEQKLESLIKELKRTKSKIYKEKKVLERAEEYDKQLNYANFKRERKIIHNTCEKELGDSSPLRIIREKNKIIRALSRDLLKIEERAQKVAKKASREIESLIIDGNNLCYESSVFIGLKALISVSKALAKKFNIVVVFDSNIRSMLKKGDDEIRKLLGEEIKTHIVATKEKADETILDLASENSSFYVISNDRFADYFEKDAVKNDRLIRHVIVNNMVLIHDLDIKENF